MVIHPNSIPSQPAERFPERYSHVFCRDIPERLVDSTQRRHGDDTSFEERMAIHDLPQAFDIPRIPTNDQLRKILDCADDGSRLELDGCLPEPVQSRLVSLYTHDDPVTKSGVDDLR